MRLTRFHWQSLRHIPELSMISGISIRWCRCTVYAGQYAIFEFYFASLTEAYVAARLSHSSEIGNLSSANPMSHIFKKSFDSGFGTQPTASSCIYKPTEPCTGRSSQSLSTVYSHILDLALAFLPHYLICHLVPLSVPTTTWILLTSMSLWANLTMSRWSRGRRKTPTKSCLQTSHSSLRCRRSCPSQH